MSCGGLVTQPRRKIRQRQKRRVNLLHQFPILFRFRLHALPLRVILEGLPVRCRRFPARMLQNVKERAAFHRIVQCTLQAAEVTTNLLLLPSIFDSLQQLGASAFRSKANPNGQNR